MLAYYDIFKTYYANKQEEDAYVISRSQSTKHIRVEKVYTIKNGITYSDGSDGQKAGYHLGNNQEIPYNFNEDIPQETTEAGVQREIYIEFNANTKYLNNLTAPNEIPTPEMPGIPKIPVRLSYRPPPVILPICTSKALTSKIAPV